MKMDLRFMVRLVYLSLLIKLFLFLNLESRAICRYLELKYKGKGTELVPSKDAAAIGLFEQAASIETSYFDGPASGIVFERVFKK
jgi:glutathione S-transferase